MKHQIIVAGKPALAYAKTGTAEYLKRLKRYGSYDLKHIKDGSSEDVSQRLLEGSEGTLRIVMDERGESLNTAQLTKKINAWEMRGVKRASYLIGASDGHTEELRQQADLVWALSPLTLQHELALVVLLEQLYRIATIQRGEPYHR
ncbi:23S rRNA (pseudouridine(1915)-N(3))-methyltransferase RlmH [Verrucomicrobiaceae bacterium R5-34]|uniref:Ribosomal RNA large subunit methyltransferase H n=1 Tax=Oceaniferula flava TaxID=2800421 RepID=A0AAE2S9D8_9BACT|nr:23S rRNA (pseudouridine(1915)-N(3))-methyltransferase RlmH [Oceaniferula flavus]MBK1829196.1 23S rRNA (pseudouridine(1915)-N(3))-methyltransferase RlmH [Verrucomicrobiaceae bacterium R5-34]MBK1853433.1 23S rRNA (pseudouridine(1915)-N(3))-methyltransferase RlmH [Oceaniferula flavus]MBM1134738.1 23S rRNA (pseudouridine(1915)-N(3))-methyltransferase RlmH [Oceaniferula flavus]